jgi:uncharacterized membrane protein
VTWSSKFRRRQYLRSSLWVWPVIGAFIGAAAGPLDVIIDKEITLPSVWQYSPSIATTLLSAIVGASAALTGFVVTVTVLVVQMAIGTFSARYMRLIYRDPVLKAVLALLIGTTTFSLSILRRVTPDFVPNVGLTIDGLLIVASLIFFLLFLDRFMHRLRPVAVAALVAEQAQNTVLSSESVLSIGEEPLTLPQDVPPRIITNVRAGAIQAIDARGLLAWANERETLVVLRHAIGDFVPSGAELIDVYGRVGDGDVAALRGMIALGHERTIEQDTAFGLRVMVDVAIRALSSAINDPTSAVQVLDYLGETLQMLGARPQGAWTEGRHADGRRLLLIRTPSWADYLALAVTEIREYGAGSVQVLRRLRALLEELAASVVPHHVAAVEAELARLDATVAAGFAGSNDFDRASTADRQGLGGPAEWEALTQSRGVPG